MNTKDLLVISGIPVEVTRKNIKNLHLAVYPPNGRVTVSAPSPMQLDAIRSAVVTRLAWVKRQQKQISLAPRQSPREMISGESHYYLGQRYRMRVLEYHGGARIRIKGKAILLLEAHPSASLTVRLNALDHWYRTQLNELVPPLIETWAARIGVEDVSWRMRRMRTRWATIDVKKRVITVNPEIAKQPLEGLESVIVHELMHIFEPNHGEGFILLMNQHLPDWRERKSRLDSALLSCEDWKC